LKQVVQSVADGKLQVLDVPRPSPRATEVLVATTRTVLSPGTERAVRKLASSSLLQKARARPDLVRQVVKRARSEGLRATATAVRSRLNEDMPLGYSGVGTVLQVGEAVQGLTVGQRVATGSAGHADYQIVPGHLAVPVPNGVTDADAAFATIAAIALHGLRQADVGPGSKVCVIGLGLVGQLTARLAMAAGCSVAGIDLREWTAELLTASGGLGLVEGGADTTDRVLSWSGVGGADAVILTAATPSSDPARRATELARDRAALVVVGDVGLDLQRTPFYEKELRLLFARSYGPGRYDRTYEEWGVDYPIGYVRWTEGRNLSAFLDLVASSRLSVDDLVTHTFPVEQASEAYALVDGAERSLGIQLTYRPEAIEREVIHLADRRPATGLGVGLVGAGNYAKATLLPALRQAGFERLVAVASESGLSARSLAERFDGERAMSSVEPMLELPEVDVVVIATRHDSHARLVVQALDAGKHVFCEKPLALDDEQLSSVVESWRGSPGVLMVGFNRRYSKPVQAVKAHLAAGSGPLVLTYRINAGRLGADHWYHDRRQGGRLLGEVCHFVDTCSAIVDAPVDSVLTWGSGRGEALLDEDLVVSLRYRDGSVAAITYGSGGHSATPKERLEVLGRGHSCVIDDFHTLFLDGRKSKVPDQNKGHAACLTVMREQLISDTHDRTLTARDLATSAVVLAAAKSLLEGGPVKPLTF
jgi:predicted dehydrogenase/threonine dehydrogenase-like Zn-dependent dehydrogenase